MYPWHLPEIVPEQLYGHNNMWVVGVYELKNEKRVYNFVKFHKDRWVAGNYMPIKLLKWRFSDPEF